MAAQRILQLLLKFVPQAAAVGEPCTPFMELLRWALGRKPDNQVRDSCSAQANVTLSVQRKRHSADSCCMCVHPTLRVCVQGARHSPQRGMWAPVSVLDCITRQDVVAVFLTLKAQNARLAHHANASLYKSLQVCPVRVCALLSSFSGVLLDHPPSGVGARSVVQHLR